MNLESRNEWKNAVLDEVFEALAESSVLMECLVFKGARILNKRLGSYPRQSLDIDSNLLSEFVERYGEYDALEKILKEEMEKAITNYFENQDPVKYSLQNLRIERSPPKGHVHGWDAFKVHIAVDDLSKPGVRGLPNLSIDIAAPEEIDEKSIDTINIGDRVVKAYTLERIAGEKLRAFLSTLPSYREKLKKPGDVIRVKDLYDIARIYKECPISNEGFWNQAGIEFSRACKSRFIDCEGMSTFSESKEITEETYKKEKTLPSDIDFSHAWSVLESIVESFEKSKVVPFYNPVPEQV